MEINIVKHVQGKFGAQVQDAQGNYYSFSKFYKGTTTPPIGSYNADVFVTQKGNRYINAINTGNTSVPVVETPKRGRPKKVETVETPKQDLTVGDVVTPPVNFVPKLERPTGRDFDRENFGKVKSLFLQALMPMLITNAHDEEEVKTIVRKWAKYCFEDDR